MKINVNPVNFRIPGALAQKIREEADHRGITPEDLVEDLLWEAVGGRPASAEDSE